MVPAQKGAKSGPVAVAILAGDHDLPDRLKRLGGACEYLRVTVLAYQQVRVS
jgi:hypothetical protein